MEIRKIPNQTYLNANLSGRDDTKILRSVPMTLVYFPPPLLHIPFYPPPNPPPPPLEGFIVDGPCVDMNHLYAQYNPPLVYDRKYALSPVYPLFAHIFPLGVL